jgi:uncharacterized DUF497 family protein
MAYDFEWDLFKDIQNQEKHGVAFDLAQYAFLDPNKLIEFDLDHSGQEQRFFCYGAIDSEILTVRFTLRNDRIRIIGAGFWRKGKAIYENENKKTR